jgi:hypothetical protein
MKLLYTTALPKKTDEAAALEAKLRAVETTLTNSTAMLDHAQRQNNEMEEKVTVYASKADSAEGRVPELEALWKKMRVGGKASRHPAVLFFCLSLRSLPLEELMVFAISSRCSPNLFLSL